MTEAPKGFLDREEYNLQQLQRELVATIDWLRTLQISFDDVYQHGSLFDPEAQSEYRQLRDEIDEHMEKATALRTLEKLDIATIISLTETSISILEKHRDMLHRAQRDLTGISQELVLQQLKEIAVELELLQGKLTEYRTNN